MEEVRSIQVAPSTVGGVLEDLHDEGVRYCHFKSNAHVDAGVAGLTDLDVLVDRRDKTRAEEALARRGFKRLAAHASRAYPGVDDFFGLDEETGRLLHLHMHYRLIVGERFFKNYRLPWENEFLETRALDQATGVFVADPALEWLLLACRAALKLRWRDRLRQGRERAGMSSEHRWLAERTEPAAVAEHASRLLGAETAERVGRALAEDLRRRRLAELRRELLRSPRVFRAYRPLSAVMVRWERELTWVLGTVNRRYLHRPFPYRRSGSSGGTVVALVGSDGAGKSSVVEALHSWLGGKVDVVTIYFGSGQGPSSILRWPLKLALRVARRGSGPPRLDPDIRRSRDVSVPRAIWAVLLAREKRAKVRTAMRARERGFIVICDRYPQTQVGGVSDGPLLWRWHESTGRLKRRLARWEREIYELGAAIFPDVVVRLIVAPETAAQRRPGDDPRELAFRTRLVKDLRFETARYGVTDVAADEDLESVILQVKRALWPVI